MQNNTKAITRNTVLLLLLAIVGIMAMSTGTALAAVDTTAPSVSSVTPANGSTIYTNGASTIYYQFGNPTPLTIRATYADEPGGSGVDPASVMVHLDGSNMLYDCPTQTATEVACNATAADLFPGTHPVDIYVADVEGNMTMHRTWVTVVSDSLAPTYANLSIANGSIIYTSQLNSSGVNDLGALRFAYDIIDGTNSSSVVPMTHINESVPPGVLGAMIMNTSCVKTPDANNTTHYSCQVNRAKLLKLGDNTLSILLKDRVGNMSSDYSNAAGLNHFTVVDDVAPVVSGVTADGAAIDASYSDPQPTGALSTSLAAGIDSGTATVKIDGSTVSGCTATTTGVSCPTPAGLSVGDHAVVITIGDNAGNQGQGTTTLTIDPPACVPGKPALSLSMKSIAWASYADFQARELSMVYRITNSGSDIADNVAITGSNNTNGVILITPAPLALGSIAGGGAAETTAIYLVPTGVGSFRASVTASASDGCGTSYGYPV
ncbi:MAG: hypothetical protein ACYC5A_08830 [Thermoleophilia bacterium]